MRRVNALQVRSDAGELEPGGDEAADVQGAGVSAAVDPDGPGGERTVIIIVK